MITKKCQYCNKKIEAYSEEQAELLILQHIVSKHREKIKLLK